MRPAELHSRSAEENCSTEHASSLRSVKVANLLETFNAGGNTYRILQNVDNYVVVWLTPHFECCISMSADSTDISSLKNIILSMQ